MIIEGFLKYAETMKNVYLFKNISEVTAVVFTIAVIMTLCVQILKNKNINQ